MAKCGFDLSMLFNVKYKVNFRKPIYGFIYVSNGHRTPNYHRDDILVSVKVKSKVTVRKSIYNFIYYVINGTRTPNYPPNP